MVDIVEASAIEAANYVHYIIEDDCFVEGALLGHDSGGVDAGPFAVFNLVAEQVVKPLLAGIDTSEDENCRVHDDS